MVLTGVVIRGCWFVLLYQQNGWCFVKCQVSSIMVCIAYLEGPLCCRKKTAGRAGVAGSVKMESPFFE